MKLIMILSINLDDLPCDWSTDWCGWKNVCGWKRVKYQELDQDHQHDIGDKNIEDDKDNDFQISVVSSVRVTHSMIKGKK